MKIYSCSPFYNEFDVLELRLREMYDHVDYFILVEANTTYTGRPKPFLLEENWERFKPWADKIRHIKVTDMPGHENPWQNERHQRNQILQGLYDADPEDFVIVSDVDEIIRPLAIQYVRDNPDHEVYGFKMPLFNFRYNYMMINQDFHNIWSMGCHRRLLDQVQPEDFKHSRIHFNFHPGVCNIDHAGWHFTWLGDEEFVQNKLGSFSHNEADRPDVRAQIDLEASIESGMGYNRMNTPERYVPVKMDWYMPQTLTNNLEKYQDWIIPNADYSAVDFLPPWQYNV